MPQTLPARVVPPRAADLYRLGLTNRAWTAMTTIEQGNRQALRKRRQLITGAAAVAAGTALMSTSGEARASDVDVANVRDFREVADLSWDSAVQKALATGKAIYFPPGDYEFNEAIAASNRDLVIFGEGPDVSRLVFLNATNGITFAGTRTSTAVHELVVHHIGLLAANAGCETAIHCAWTLPLPTQDPLTGASTLAYAIIEHVSVAYANTASRFRKGVFHSNGVNSRISNCIFSQLNYATHQRDGTGVHLVTGGADNQIVGCQFDGQAIGVHIEGDVQGTRVVDSSFLGDLVGIRADGTNLPLGLDWLLVTGCHINVAEIGIDALSVFHLQVENNYFLAVKIANINWFGVRIRRTTTGQHFFEDSSITHNIFHYNNINLDTSPPQPWTSDAYPIHITGLDDVRKTNRILIDGNRFGGSPWTNTATLGGRTTLITYTDTNLADNGEVPNDQGSGNIIYRKDGLYQVEMTSTGSPTTKVGVANIDWIRNGNLVSYQVTLIVTIGGGSGALHVPMPFKPAAHSSLAGMQINNGVGPACQGIIATDGLYPQVLRVVYYHGGYPGQPGNILQVTGNCMV
jgi:hypothetical protein